MVYFFRKLKYSYWFTPPFWFDRALIGCADALLFWSVRWNGLKQMK